MKIKRYFAPDMRQAIRLVREEQGPDAVILSSRSVDGGIEIISAVDFDQDLVAGMAGSETAPAPSAREPELPPLVATQDDPLDLPAIDAVLEPPLPGRRSRKPGKPKAEVSWTPDPAIKQMQQELQDMRGLLQDQLEQLAWSDFQRRDPLKARVSRNLQRLGLSEEVTQEIVDRIPSQLDGNQAWRQAMLDLARALPVVEDDLINRGGMIALVGPTGVGKTTTVAKLASRFVMRNGKHSLALVTTDAYRVGAYKQLATFGQILGVPVHLAQNGEELCKVLEDLGDKRLVLIDTAGMSQRDMRLAENFATLDAIPFVKSYLVLSANVQRQAMEEVVRGYGRIRPAGCILTKLDETASLGGALSVLIENRLRLAYVSDGQRVPEDLHPARADSLVKQAIGMVKNTQATVAAAAGVRQRHPKPAIHAHV